MSHPLREKSYSFALRIIQLCAQLDAKKAFTISKQLLRSGTSIGANTEEAQQAQSRADFISKYSGYRELMNAGFNTSGLG